MRFWLAPRDGDLERTSEAQTKKSSVHRFWESASCGETLYLDGDSAHAYEEQANKRYALEPYIFEFAGFADARGKHVLEIGLGLGADHEQFARNGAVIWGIDLTARSVQHVRRRFALLNLPPRVQVGDAESLPFPDESFDIVYSWGVLHHTPKTSVALREVLRVLKPGGEARIMIYHKHSVVGYMLWARYSLPTLRFGRSLDDIYENYLESPGTKAYTIQEAQALFARFIDVRIRTVLTHGDLLTSDAGQRHHGVIRSVAKAIWPRRLIRTFLPGHGLFMLVQARKHELDPTVFFPS